MKHHAKTFGETQSHAFTGSRQNPHDAKARLPINGSNLYHEGEGRIVTLFPAYMLDLQPSVGAALAPVLPPLSDQRFRIVGHTFAIFANGSNGITNLFIQFFKNAQSITDIFPINRQFAFVGEVPVSPNAASTTATSTVGVGSAQVMPIYRLEFDEVRLINTTGVAFAFNALIAQGRSEIDW